MLKYLIYILVFINCLPLFSEEIFIYSEFDSKLNREKYGYISETGKIIHQAEFDIVYDFSDSIGAAMNYDGDVFLINSEGKIIKKIMQATIQCPIEEDFRAYPNMIDGILSEGLLPIGKYTDEENYWNYIWGYIDKTGKNIIRPNYVLTVGFKEGYAPTLTYLKDTLPDGTQELKWGYLNRNYRMTIAPQFEYASHYSERFAAVQVETQELDSQGNKISKWGYIDKKGEFAIKPIFDAAYRFSGGLANVLIKVMLEDSTFAYKWGYINQKGDMVIKPQFDDAMPFSEGLAAVGIADEGEPNSLESNPKCIWGFIDTTGNFIIKPQFDEVDSFSEGRAAAAIYGDTDDETEQPDLVWGYINSKGEAVIDFQFTGAMKFKDGKAKVSFIDEDFQTIISIIDKDGKDLITPIKAELYCPNTYFKDKFYRGY